MGLTNDIPTSVANQLCDQGLSNGSAFYSTDQIFIASNSQVIIESHYGAIGSGRGRGSNIYSRVEAINTNSRVTVAANFEGTFNGTISPSAIISASSIPASVLQTNLPVLGYPTTVGNGLMGFATDEITATNSGNDVLSIANYSASGYSTIDFEDNTAIARDGNTAEVQGAIGYGNSNAPGGYYTWFYIEANHHDFAYTQNGLLQWGNDIATHAFTVWNYTYASNETAAATNKLFFIGPTTGNVQTAGTIQSVGTISGSNGFNVGSTNVVIDSSGNATFAGNVKFGGTATGNGNGLTNLNATNIAGTVATNNLPSALAALSANNGGGLTNVYVDHIRSGVSFTTLASGISYYMPFNGAESGSSQLRLECEICTSGYLSNISCTVSGVTNMGSGTNVVVIFYTNALAAAPVAFLTNTVSGLSQSATTTNSGALSWNITATPAAPVMLSLSINPSALLTSQGISWDVPIFNAH